MERQKYLVLDTFKIDGGRDTRKDPVVLLGLPELVERQGVLRARLVQATRQRRDAMSAHVAAILVGRIAPLGPERVPSAFVKVPVAGPVEVNRLGLVGDEQADLRVHGGPDKAVYGYAGGHYAAWCQEYPQHKSLLGPGGFGENLTINGLDESHLCVGDLHAIGSALLQVCQPRQPCFKFALRFEDVSLPRAMTRNGRSGWYYRVVQEGWLRPGDAVILHERPNPDFSFTRLIAIVNRSPATTEELVRMRDMPGLAEGLKDQARSRLDHR
jgi:MOSC domain-containing protein YiiM